MDEIYIFVKESQAAERRKARAAMWQSIREGKALSFEEAVKARGLVIRERENSIFSDAWVPLAIFFVLIGLAAGRNPELLALGIVLLVVVGVGAWWKNVSLAGVTYERSFDRTHVFPDEPITMTLDIANRKPLPLTWLQFKDELPAAPDEEDQIAAMATEKTGSYVLQNTLSMQAFERTHRSVSFRIARRGFYKVGPVRYQSGDIFTLFTIERQHKYEDTLVVYPQVWPLDALQLPAKELFGEFQVRRSLFTDPIKTQGIRDYQPQDRFRDVHWKATARRGDLQTKVYDPSSGMSVVVFLNVATYAKHWMGFDPVLLERAVSVAASMASYAAEQKWAVGVLANGAVPGSDQPIRVPPGRSPEQLIHILEALAAVTEFATGSMDLLMQRESRRLPLATTLVLVTAVVTEEIMVSLLRLKEAGRRVVLISLADEPPRCPPGILAYHTPSTLPAFQRGHKTGTATEAALAAIPVPEGV
ncbi:MAG: DUF58 domain-containing protein [Chloroflexi bacterium]|nr:DUF58 domain-containing protein [Chloroflexota bacterium]MCI0576195.1 DUF58 domain-containing protein [Chloroflexota bacterium]MCI0645511.1 DUF58 domain-containing protein [Chloroflexota bacterium]MCI0730650.1 DUF58 domain-containing protein [Chloroflexota bacterium]